MTKKNEFSKATKFVIDSMPESGTKYGIVTRKKYKTKAGFLNRIKVLGVKNLDAIKVQKTNTYSKKGIHYTFIWE
jgi:hypothetical protein